MGRARSAAKALEIFKAENIALRKEVAELKAKLAKLEPKRTGYKGTENADDMKKEVSRKK